MKSALLSPWTMRLLGALVLALLVWFAGPLLAFADYHPLEPEWARIALIAALLLFWLVRYALRQMRARLGNRKLFDLIVDRADARGKPGSGNSAQIRERFEKAAALLKTTRFENPGGKPSRLRLFGGRRYAYQLPWYLFIGAPGSGKTTALMHSGLQFPLADALGTDPLHGIGGTRNCEWWFTDQAVLIDTAGRYTTQDSNAGADAGEWKEFVDLIKRFRPRQPINGVLATISASDLLGAGEAEVQKQATALRTRIGELQRHLGHSFPVYLLVTKTDLLPGFTQFFEDLTREQREQVWGFTLDFSPGGLLADSAQQLRPQLDALEGRLYAQLLPRLQASRDGSARALTYGFPNQWVQLKEAVADFAAQAFSASRLAGPMWLRGIYFTSGTQEGSPIDRVLGSLARSFGIERKMLPPQKPSGKSFFITRLLREVVFAESNLAGTDRNAEKRLLRWKWGGIAAGGLAMTAAIAVWTASYVGNDRYIAEVAAGTDRFRKELAQDPPSIDDLPAILAVLERTQALAHAGGVDPREPQPEMRAGLFQGEKLQAGAEQAYGRMLSAYLAPHISQRIEARLRQQDGNPELQYETLKAYLTLHRQGKADQMSLKSWVAFDLDSDKRQPVPEDAREKVMAHLATLLQRDAIGPAAGGDPKLVSAVRQAQLQAPFAQRVYNRIKRQSPPASLREFRVTDAGGPNSQLVLARVSGQPITSPVPGLFTYNGYYKAFNPQLDAMLRQLADEEVWVLGVKDSENARRAAAPASRRALGDEVRQLYLQDYASLWERFIADLALVKTANLSQSIEQARILSAPDSPLPRLLRGLAREVTLGERPRTEKPPPGKVKDMISQGKDQLGALMGMQGQDSAMQEPEGRKVEAIVDERFEALRRFVRSPGGNQPAPVDASLTLINDLYTLLTATDAALKAGNTLPQSEVPNRVKAEAARMPEPMRSMLTGLADASLRQAISSSRSNLSTKLAGMVGEPCHKALAGRYPFTPGSKKDVVPEDFVRIMARDGVMDEFFQKNLAPLVDTSTRPWRFRNLGDPSTGGVSEALIQFERAQEIRRVFFPPGSNGFGFRVNMRPVDMDKGIDQSILDIDGQLVSYAHDNVPAMLVQWPGPRASNQITLTVTLARGGDQSQSYEGPWALFRLFERAQIVRSAQPERFRATVHIAGRRVTYDVTTSSVQNPFRLPELQAFQCPAKL
ncbi:type VI secretion system membrane subunit TssM [Noviherbaspirillum sp.]|uniref:type VI secretion system membrane subunit TssM n=1 Tax=Noviherbaspirillum sp. TaxID=1926288 RepID=UPI002D26EE3F|nr:type VI secretion system membrane subunit TssM [Noviherbaspirillum sp.]HZW19935.1 type VI secretion system membrane subunit TssM [Noviherbaspirillum sp.]